MTKDKKRKGKKDDKKLDFEFIKGKGKSKKRRPISQKEIQRKLMSTKERTAKRILDNPFASPIEKMRARRSLSK